MSYMGIDRGDGRTPEQKSAAENVEVAYSIYGHPVVFRCRGGCKDGGSRRDF